MLNELDTYIPPNISRSNRYCCSLIVIFFRTLLQIYIFWSWLNFSLLPESARWLASKGRLEEASVIIRQAAKVNNADVSEKVLSLRELESDGPQEKIWKLFTNSRLLVRCLIIFFNWSVTSMFWIFYWQLTY